MVKSDQLTSSENMVYQRIMRPVSSKVTEPLLKFDWPLFSQVPPWIIFFAAPPLKAKPSILSNISLAPPTLSTLSPFPPSYLYRHRDFVDFDWYKT